MPFSTGFLFCSLQMISVWTNLKNLLFDIRGKVFTRCEYLTRCQTSRLVQNQISDRHSVLLK